LLINFAVFHDPLVWFYAEVVGILFVDIAHLLFLLLNRSLQTILARVIGQLQEQFFGEILCFAKSMEVLLKFVIEFESTFRGEPGSNDHVANVNGIG